MMELEWKVVQVTNVSPTVTKEQMLHFFEYVGRVKDLKLYPEVDDPTSVPVATKVCYVRYESAECAKVALHLGNTVFVDRALIVVPFPDLNIPDEMKAMRVAAPASAVAGILPPTLQWPPQVVNMICGTGPHQTIQTIDSKLIEHGLPVYPPLPGNTEPSKIEEIRRTVYASNLDSAVNTEQLVQFFSQAGEVKYVRMAGDENMPSRNAYIEFTSQKSIPMALGYSGVMLNGRPLKVTHSLSVIANKPQTKNEEALAKEIDEAMKKVKESQHVMAAAAEGADAKRRSRSTSKTRKRRSRTRSKERRRSRERDRRRSSQRDINSEKVTKVSRERYRRSRSRERSRERERERERDRSREKRKRSRTPPRGHRTGRKSRSASREKRRRSKSRDRKETSSKTRGSSIPKSSGTPVKPPDEGSKLREDKVSDVKYAKSTASDADVIRNGEGESTQDSTREVEESKTEVSNGDSLAPNVSGTEGESTSAKEIAESDKKPVDVEVKQRKSRSKSPAKKERSRIDARLEKYADYSSSKKRRSKSPVKKADERSSRRSGSRSRTRRSTSKTRSRRSRSRSHGSTSKSRTRRSTSKTRARRSPSRSHRKRSVSKTRSSKKSRSRSRQRRERSRSKEKRSRSKEKRRRSRSQSGDKRSKKKKDRSRSRDRSSKNDHARNEHASQRRSSTDRQVTKDQKRQSKEKESNDDKKEVKVKRDYDEEEKGFDSGADKVVNVETKPPLDSLVKTEPVEQSEDGRSEDMVTDDKSEDMVMDDKSEDAPNAEDSRSSFVSSNAAGEDSQQ